MRLRKRDALQAPTFHDGILTIGSPGTFVQCTSDVQRNLRFRYLPFHYTSMSVTFSIWKIDLLHVLRSSSS